MPTKKKAASRPAAETPSPAEPDEPDRSDELQVILPASDEPVRRGGYVLTENGWELEHPGAGGLPATPAVPDEENEE